MAGILRNELSIADIKFLTHSPSNQIFPILSKSLITELQRNYSFYIWEEVDSNFSAIRLVTSWTTKEDEVLAFITEVKKLNLPSTNQ